MMDLHDLPLIAPLQTAAGLLDPVQDAELRSHIATVCDRTQNPNLRIAVFGPFNFGKSTLLNALLGERTLPMDLIPTTGAGILVRAGAEQRTRITLTDGTVIDEPGTAVLADYAVLDQERHMRSDVAAVEVQCPHALLSQGIEFLDLPGTNDREQQDDFIQDQLLQADLVIQLVDGRQLMTLLEREHLRDWLLERGITSVIFVVNFLNLVEPEDQQKVMTRLRAIAESFRTHLPPGISNLYRVDALPALRAKLKGDQAAMQTTGLPMLESAIQAVVAHSSDLTALRAARLEHLAQQVAAALVPQVQGLEMEICDRKTRHTKTIEIKRKAQTILQQDFHQQVAHLRDWLNPLKLIEAYQSSATEALLQGTFDYWLSHTLRPAWKQHQRAIVAPVHKACDFFSQPRPTELWVQFAPAPKLAATEPTAATPASTANAAPEDPDLSPVALATGVGLLLSGPVGAAVLGGASYLLNRNSRTTGAAPDTVPQASPAAQASQAVQAYLQQFSLSVAAALDQYQHTVHGLLYEPPQESPPDLSRPEQQLRLLEHTISLLTPA